MQGLSLPVPEQFPGRLEHEFESLDARGMKYRRDELAWKDGRLTHATIQSSADDVCRISYRGKTVELKIKKGRGLALNGDLEEN